MIPLGEAQAEVIAACAAAPAEIVDVGDALGLVLAERVTAVEDVPPFANTAMDGYAVRAADIAEASADAARPADRDRHPGRRAGSPRLGRPWRGAADHDGRPFPRGC